MPNTSTSTACTLDLGAKMLLKTRITRVVNSEEDRSVCSTGQPLDSARASRCPVGCCWWVNTQQGTSLPKNISRVSFWPSRSSFHK